MTLRDAVRLVAALNFAYFAIEFGVAKAIGSVSLFADSIDFLEDASVNTLIAIALGWSASRRARAIAPTRAAAEAASVGVAHQSPRWPGSSAPETKESPHRVGPTVGQPHRRAADGTPPS